MVSDRLAAICGNDLNPVRWKRDGISGLVVEASAAVAAPERSADRARRGPGASNKPGAPNQSGLTSTPAYSTS